MELGCNIGNDVIANPTGIYPFGNIPFLPPNNELYDGDVFNIYRNGDTQCGLVRNMYNFTGKQCVVKRTFGYSHGNVVSFDRNVDTNCPLDESIIGGIIMVVLVIIGLKQIRKRKNAANKSGNQIKD